MYVGIGLGGYNVVGERDGVMMQRGSSRTVAVITI